MTNEVKEIKYDDLLKSIVEQNYYDINFYKETNSITITRTEHIIENNTECYKTIIYVYDDIDVIDFIIDLLATQEEMIRDNISQQIKTLLKE